MTTGQPRQPLANSMVRTASYVSDVLVVVAGVIVAVFVGTTWSWPLFAAGLGLGAGSILLSEAMRRFFIRYLRPELSAERLEHARADARMRRRITMPTMLAVGALVALVSASTGSATLVVVGVVITMLFLVIVPVALLPTTKRRLQRGPGRPA